MCGEAALLNSGENTDVGRLANVKDAFLIVTIQNNNVKKLRTPKCRRKYRISQKCSLFAGEADSKANGNIGK